MSRAAGLSLALLLGGCASITEVMDADGQIMSRTLAIGAPSIQVPEGPHSVRQRLLGIGYVADDLGVAGGAGGGQRSAFYLGKCHVSFRVGSPAAARELRKIIGPATLACIGVE